MYTADQKLNKKLFNNITVNVKLPRPLESHSTLQCTISTS